VSFPGRLDSDPKFALQMPTLLAPARWAFMIWTLIFIGEFVGLIYLYICEKSKDTKSIANGTAAWCAANMAQSLWCCAFRPWAKDKLWLSAALLGTIAACLFPAQLKAKRARNRTIHLLVVFPRSLHLGWTTAATLVNLNNYFGATYGPSVAWTAVMGSIVAAVFIGIFYIRHGLLSATGAVAWALCACSRGRPKGANVDMLGPDTIRSLMRNELLASLLLCIAILNTGIRRGCAFQARRQEEPAASLSQPLLKAVGVKGVEL